LISELFSLFTLLFPLKSFSLGNLFDGVFSIVNGILALIEI
jgi:hypothetical protein